MHIEKEDFCFVSITQKRMGGVKYACLYICMLHGTFGFRIETLHEPLGNIKSSSAILEYKDVYFNRRMASTTSRLVCVVIFAGYWDGDGH